MILLDSAEMIFTKLVRTAWDCYLLVFVISLVNMILAALIGIQFSKVQWAYHFSVCFSGIGC